LMKSARVFSGDAAVVIEATGKSGSNGDGYAVEPNVTASGADRCW